MNRFLLFILLLMGTFLLVLPSSTNAMSFGYGDVGTSTGKASFIMPLGDGEYDFYTGSRDGFESMVGEKYGIETFLQDELFQLWDMPIYVYRHRWEEEEGSGSPAPVPEPATLLLMTAGSLPLAIGSIRSRLRRRKAG